MRLAAVRAAFHVAVIEKAGTKSLSTSTLTMNALRSLRSRQRRVRVTEDGVGIEKGLRVYPIGASKPIDG